MIDSGLKLAADFASQGAQVIYVCEHHLVLADALHDAQELAGDNLSKIRKTSGAQRIETYQGGRICFFAPRSTGGRGVSADVVFAPPFVWNDAELAASLIASTDTSKFFDVGGPFFYSTLQRIDI